MATYTELTEHAKKIHASPISHFYQIHSPSDEYAHFPFLTDQILYKTPLTERLYTKEKYFAKVVTLSCGKILWARTQRDIWLEQFGATGERPLVAFDSIQELLEKGIWCYGQNALPLLLHNNDSIGVALAKKYEIDSIVAHPATLARILPELKRQCACEKITHISLIGEIFDTAQIRETFPHAIVTCVLATSITGAIAHARMLDGTPLTFEPTKNMHVDTHEEMLIVSSTLPLPTPLLRYQTAINVSSYLFRDKKHEK